MNPIRSRRELEDAIRTMKELRQQLAMLRKTYRNDPAACELATRGLRQLVHETKHAIATYEQAREGQLPPVVGARNDRTGQLELPRVLRLLRHAAQLDQAQLAEQLGTRQANISRWEREGYDRYNLRQLVRLADVLGYDVEVAFVRRKETKA